LAQRREHAQRVLGAIGDLQVLELSVNQPDIMKASVLETLDTGRSAGSHLLHSHALARRQLKKWAASAGAAPVLIIVDEAATLEEEEDHPHVFHLNSDQLSEMSIDRTPMPVDKRTTSGPFDIIGDIHGCA